jgi:Flp pilus assembly protein TadG
MAILTPAFLLLIVMAIVAGRTAVAHQAIDLAAHDAARAASIARDAATARQAATTATAEALAGQGLHCANDVAGDLVVDTAGFALPADSLELGFVTVTVTCEVSFADVALAGIRPTRELTATFVSPVDIFRERS